VIGREIHSNEVNPHTILYVFLPVLIFESAYAMEAHMFFRSFPQITILAVPGLGITVVVQSFLCHCHQCSISKNNSACMTKCMLLTLRYYS